MFIGIFGHHTPISDYIVSRNEQLEHVSHHPWKVSVMVPDERKEVAPILDSEFVEPVLVKMTAMTKRAFFNDRTIYHLNFIDRLEWMLGIVTGIRRTDDHRISFVSFFHTGKGGP